VIHNGPLPYAIHGLLEYVVGILLIVAPFVLDFSGEGAATAVSIVAGVVVLGLAATTRGPTSLNNALPVSVHVLADLALGAVFIAAPFLFGFSDKGSPTALFIALGVLTLLGVVATRYPRLGREGAVDPGADRAG
jgi:hypothetical protein